MRKRTLYVWGVAIICFVVLMIVTPAIPQSQEYHNFADQREFFGYLHFSLLLFALFMVYECFFSLKLYESQKNYTQNLASRVEELRSL